MTIRETIEDMERETLSPYATLSENSRGRDREEPQCDIQSGLSKRPRPYLTLQVFPSFEK